MRAVPTSDGEDLGAGCSVANAQEMARYGGHTFAPCAPVTGALPRAVSCRVGLGAGKGRFGVLE